MQSSPRRVRKIGRKVQRQKKTNLLQSLFFILLILAAGFVFLQSSIFAVDNIEVKGTKFLNPEEVRKLTGLSLGVNIFKADLKAAGAKVSLNPLVKQVEVFRDLPSGVVVQITERQPVGLLPFRGGLLEVDGEGYYLAQAPVGHQGSLPIINGVKVEQARLGKRVDNPRLSGPLSYLAAMSPEFISKISEINGADPVNIIMYSLDKVMIKLGDETRVKEKLSLVEGRLKQKYPVEVEYIDVSFKGYPVIKFKEEYNPNPEVNRRPAVDESEIH
ncbi:MAG: FtsQ-type POTRA domain-containing protein [Clostridia bacterium]|nr:FtsQ-type POTRA domain-containing protein [Clostridia bacterium]